MASDKWKAGPSSVVVRASDSRFRGSVQPLTLVSPSADSISYLQKYVHLTLVSTFKFAYRCKPDIK